jgi:hypothetical protein
VQTTIKESIRLKGEKNHLKALEIEINNYTDEKKSKVVVCPHITLFGVQLTTEGSGFHQNIIRVGCKVCKKKYPFKLETWY